MFNYFLMSLVLMTATKLQFRNRLFHKLIEHEHIAFTQAVLSVAEKNVAFL